MLNPPLSLLSDELLNLIVDHVAEVPCSDSDLYNLSITDRAFTRFCQAYIFKALRLGSSRKLAKTRKILNNEPSFANRVREIHINVIGRRKKWLWNDPTFVTIIQLLAKSLMPPHKLHITGIFEDPVLIVGRLMQTFFSQTLTILSLTYCTNVPLTLFLVCPNLREVYLDNVGVFESRDDEYPDTQCSGRELPALEHLNYLHSTRLVKQMITPPPNFSMAVVDWSKLRVLVLYLRDMGGMVRLQHILDAACNTLEELYLTHDFNNRGLLMEWPEYIVDEEAEELAGLVDLRHLPNLHIFEIHTFIMYNTHDESVVSPDINSILGTIPKANQVTQLSFRFNAGGEHPFGGCLEQYWAGMCDEIVRLSAGKPLELYLEMPGRPSGDELYERLKEKIASLSDYSNICTQFLHP